MSNKGVAVFPGTKIRVLLVDDHVMVRESIANLLSRDPEIEIVGGAASGAEAVALARQTRPELVLMDVAMPGMDGIEASRQILHDNPDVKIIALSMYDNQAYISEMLEVGVTGFVLKTSAIDELSQAIHAARNGETYFSESVSKLIVKSYVSRVRSKPQTASGPVLSPREREVLRLISDGKSSKEIAGSLGVSPKTVESHRLHLMEKLKISNVAGLTKYALREGLTSIDS
jgi:DNA-binding NarL/FixJ family response regulator